MRFADAALERAAAALWWSLACAMFGCNAPPSPRSDADTETRDAGSRLDAYAADSYVLPIPDASVLRPGEIDLAFGELGIVETPGHAAAIALASNGDLLCGGAGSVQRLTPDGEPVATFGEDGLRRFLAGDMNTIVTHGEHIVLVSSDRDFSACYVHRIRADGTADESFGDGGTVTFPDCGFETVVVDEDGSLTVFGRRDTIPGMAAHAFELFIVRLTAAGALEPAFGGDGMIVGDELGKAYAQFIPTNAVRRTVDSIVALGAGQLVAFAADGTVDTSFGIDGAVTLTGNPGGGQRRNLVLTDSSMTVGPLGPSVLRFAPDGSRDATFGDDGSASWSSAGAADPTFGVLTVHEGRTFVVVQSRVGSEAAISVLALTSAGMPDTAFSATGWVTHTLGLTPHDPLFIYALDTVVSEDGFLYVITERPTTSSRLIRIRI
jgi:uncharacterized delta-60 repeat protein